VWRGGSVLAMVLTLQDHGLSDRHNHLFDTFEGMTEPTEVELVRETTRVIAASENKFGGGLALQMATAQLRLATGLLGASGTVEVRHAAAQAVGNLAGVVGFAAYDMADYALTDRCYDLALWCAEEGRSTALRATILADMARKAAHLDRHDEALEMVESAQALRGDLTATGRAMLAASRARLLAQTARMDEARDEIARADEWFAERDPAADPPWLCYYDDAEHQGSIGKTRLPLARAGIDVDDTIERLTAAVTQHSAEYVRSRTFSRIRLATLHCSVGDIDAAVQAAEAAMDDAATMKSTRMRDELTVLASATAGMRSARARDLRRSISAILAAG
jgi:tetratricopeptide (TPR) repeat protein